MTNLQMKVIYINKIEPINSLVNTDILLLSKFEKEFEGMNFNKTQNQPPTQPTGGFGKKKGPG